MSADAARAGRARGIGRAVFVLGAFGGSGGGVDPAADRLSGCATCSRLRAAGRYRQAWGGRLIAPAGASARARAQIRWGKSERPPVQKDMQQFSEIFGTAPGDGTGTGVRTNERIGWREPRARRSRGVPGCREPRSQDMDKRSSARAAGVVLGGTNRALVRQPIVPVRARPVAVRSHNPALLVKKGWRPRAIAGGGFSDFVRRQWNRPGLAGLNGKESDAGSKQPKRH
jgi:hypothetical protein